MVTREVHLPVAAPPSIETTLELAAVADDGGYDRLWTPETWGRNAVATLAVLADRLDNVGLGSSILNVYSRSPALLGQTAATLSELADGDFRLGLGPSGPALIERWHGVEYDRPLRRTRETVEIVRQVLGGDVVAYDGEIFDLEGFRLRHDPPSTPVPIDLAGLGPKSVELAGFIADGWHALLVTPEGLPDRLDDLERGAAKAGREGVDHRVTLSVVCCALDDGERARRLARGHLAFYVGAMGPYYAKAVGRQGHADTARAIVDRWQAGDREGAIAAIDDALLDDLAAAGTPEQARRNLERIERLDGVDAVAVSTPRGADPAQERATIDHLAPDR